ncbi:MAG: TetR/AcrR family transcriptional regulator [Candidatus Cloacimonas sp.]|jgi:TetR/AcrR family fatty acid metabolism transcriptional regulator|nr:TetR/AcrR family transcriptional regulator [Candidatus Cloacimonas sp.]
MNDAQKPLRKAERQTKRELLLNSAIEVFARKGSNLATIADVAKKARVAQGTVYVYFENKDDLLQHCMKEIIEVELAVIIKKTEHIADPMDRLYEFFMHHVTLVREKPHVARFLTVESRQSENFASRNPGYNPLRSYLTFVQDIATKAIADNKILPIDPCAFSYILVGAMDIVLCQWLASNANLDIATISLQIRQIIHGGVAITR